MARILLEVQGFHWNQCQWTNYQIIKYSSEVSQISNKSKNIVGQTLVLLSAEVNIF